MDRTTRASALFIAVSVAIAGLYWFREVMAPFALAVFLWLIIDGFASGIQERLTFKGRVYAPRPLALAFALVVVTAAVGATVVIVAESAGDFARNSGSYNERLNAAIRAVYDPIHTWFGWPDMAPTTGELFSSLNPQGLLADIARSAQGVISDGLLIGIYVAFLFAAQSTFPKKLDAMIRDSGDREKARRIFGSVRQSMERYLWVTTLTGAIPAFASYFALTWLGVDNPLFWGFVVFLLSFIPTIGPILGSILPTAFALVQFDELWRVGAVFASVAIPQFVMGNFIQPRVQGDTMNLSTLVVLLGLAVWGMLWGLTGMFLSSPLMVLVMIAFAQFASTRWIAVLLSADGRPEAGLVQARVSPQPGM